MKGLALGIQFLFQVLDVCKTCKNKNKLPQVNSEAQRQFGIDPFICTGVGQATGAREAGDGSLQPADSYRKTPPKVARYGSTMV